MKALSIFALMLATAAPVMAQDAPAGAQATACDTASYTAVRSERTGEILYWTNSTCGSSDDSEAMMMGGGMSGGMGGGMSGGMGGGMSGGMGGGMSGGMGGGMGGGMSGGMGGGMSGGM